MRLAYRPTFLMLLLLLPRAPIALAQEACDLEVWKRIQEQRHLREGKKILPQDSVERILGKYSAPETGARNSATKVNAKELRRNLEGAIENNFDLGVRGRIAGEFRPPSAQKNKETVRAARKIWEEIRPGKDLEKAVERAARTGEFTPAQVEELRGLRAYLKPIRFICEAICDERSQMNQLDRLTKRLGNLADAGKHGDKKSIREASENLLKALEKSKLKEVDEEIAGMKLLDGKKLEDELDKSIRSLRELADKKELKEKPFHDLRKAVGRLQTVQMMNALSVDGTKTERQVYQAMRNFYNELGLVHDEMEAAAYQGRNVESHVLTAAQQKRTRRIASYFEQADNDSASARASSTRINPKQLDGLPADIRDSFLKSATVMERGRSSGEIAGTIESFRSLAGNREMLSRARLAYALAAEERMRNPMLSRSEALERGIKRMLDSVGFTDGEINGQNGVYNRLVSCWRP